MHWVLAGLFKNYKVASVYAEKLERQGRLREIGALQPRRGRPLKVFCNGWVPSAPQLSWEMYLSFDLIPFFRCPIIRGLGQQSGTGAAAIVDLADDRSIVMVSSRDPDSYVTSIRPSPPPNKSPETITASAPKSQLLENWMCEGMCSNCFPQHLIEANYTYCSDTIHEVVRERSKTIVGYAWQRYGEKDSNVSEQPNLPR
jgi:hypothetical protein